MKDYEARHIFMAFGLGILALSPYLLVMLPLPLASTLYESPVTWVVSVPKNIYLFYGVGLFLLIFAFFLLFLLSLNKASKMISGVCLFFSVLFIAHGTQQYTAVTSEGISFKQTIWEGTQSYSWDEIEKVVYRENRMSGNFPMFEFHFVDGNMRNLQENRSVQPWYRMIKDKLDSLDTKFERR